MHARKVKSTPSEFDKNNPNNLTFPDNQVMDFLSQQLVSGPTVSAVTYYLQVGSDVRLDFGPGGGVRKCSWPLLTYIIFFS